jgi:acyl carrier protein
MNSSTNTQTTDQVLATITEILDDLAEDWDSGEITLEGRLIDLGMESISLVYLVAELQQHYGLGDQLFNKMRVDGSQLRDMTVGMIVDSIAQLMHKSGG